MYGQQPQAGGYMPGQPHMPLQYQQHMQHQQMQMMHQPQMMAQMAPAQPAPQPAAAAGGGLNVDDALSYLEEVSLSRMLLQSVIAPRRASFQDVSANEARILRPRLAPGS
jgi:hypothetical protein